MKDFINRVNNTIRSFDFIFIVCIVIAGIVAITNYEHKPSKNENVQTTEMIWNNVDNSVRHPIRTVQSDFGSDDWVRRNK